MRPINIIVHNQCPSPKNSSSNLDFNFSNLELSISSILSRTKRAYSLKLEANATVFTESDQEFTQAIKSNCVKNSRKGALPSKLFDLNLKPKFPEPISNMQVSLRDAELFPNAHVSLRDAEIIGATYL